MSIRTYNKLDNKRIKQLLGIQMSSLNYFSGSTETKVAKKCVETQTMSDFIIESPTILKKIKTAESTQHTYDDLYCYENLKDESTQQSSPILFPASPLPIQKEFYHINSNYLTEYKEKEYNFKTRAIILNRIQDNCQAMNNSYAHKSIYLFDLFLSKLKSKSITNQTQLRFLSLAIIFVSTKMNSETPNITQLLSQSSLNMTKQQLLWYERLILKTLDWHTNPLTLQDIFYEILLRFQQSFPQLKIYESHHLINKKLQIKESEIKIIDQILAVIVLDHHYLDYDFEDLSFSIIYQIYKVQEYDDFLKEYNKSRAMIQTSIKFVSKFIRVIQSLNEKQVDINSLEILKLVCD